MDPGHVYVGRPNDTILLKYDIFCYINEQSSVYY